MCLWLKNYLTPCMDLLQTSSHLIDYVYLYIFAPDCLIKFCMKLLGRTGPVVYLEKFMLEGT